MGKTKIVAPLQFYEMEFGYIYVFIPKCYENRLDEAMECAGIQDDNYKIILVGTRVANPL